MTDLKFADSAETIATECGTIRMVERTYRCSRGHEIRNSSDLDSAFTFTLGDKSKKVDVCLFCLADKLESLNLPKLEEVKDATPSVL